MSHPDPNHEFYCANCGEDLSGEFCDCTEEQQQNAESKAEAHYMSRWEQSMEDYEEDQIQ